MSIIKNNTSSPFRLTFQSSRGAQGGAYENVSTEATHPSNEWAVEAIAGIGKVAGGIIGNKMAKKDAAKVDEKAKIEKLEKEQNETIQRKISNTGDLEQDVISGLPTSQDDFGLAEIPST
jgi:Na+/glutamate symporter